MLIVFDLDGTLADISHRLHHIRKPDDETLAANGYAPDEWAPKWDAFFAACTDDAPIELMLDLLRDLLNAHDRFSHVPHNQVEIWTGRSAEAFMDTLEWLAAHGVMVDISAIPAKPAPHQVRLMMRRPGDHRPDTVVKKGWLDAYVADGHGKPDLVFEDRASVVQMWRHAGVLCCQVADGAF